MISTQSNGLLFHSIMIHELQESTYYVLHLIDDLDATAQRHEHLNTNFKAGCGGALMVPPLRSYA